MAWVRSALLRLTDYICFGLGRCVPLNSDDYMSMIVKRLWNASPASLLRALHRRWQEWDDKPGWVTVRSGPAAGSQILLPEIYEGAWREMLEGTFDAFLYEAISSQMQLRGAICWDVGAHVGYHSLGFASLGAQVLAFEPNRHSAHRFRLHQEKNPALARNIRCMQVAVSDRDGEMAFIQSPSMLGGSTGSHLAEALPPSRKETYLDFERVIVPTVRLDTLIERGEKPPDVIKMDVEGAEFLALQGGRKMLGEKKPFLLIEVHHICLMFHLQKLLLDLGYVTRILNEQNASASRCFISGRAK